MSQGGPAAQGAANPPEEAAQDGDQKRPADGDDAQEKRRQSAWSARRDLLTHAPDFVATLVGGDQYGQTGGAHYGDKIYQFGPRTDRARALSGPIPSAEIASLVGVFQECPRFGEAYARLKEDKVVFLSGGRDTGRRTAALMLLHRMGVEGMRSLDLRTFSALPDQLDPAIGYVVCDLAVSGNNPVREAQLLALRERLEKSRAFMVITVEPSAPLTGVPFVPWEPPPPEAILGAHVVPEAGAASWASLSGLTAVKEFLGHRHSPEEIKQFAQQLLAHHRGEISEAQLAAIGDTAVAAQVTRWLRQEDSTLHDKAFLISLAVFDKAPYAVTAELSDNLFTRLHKIQDPGVPPRIQVFGSSREERLHLARADGYVTAEVTEWGPLEGKFCAAFHDDRTAQVLLEEVWNLHPSARPALVDWIRALAEDRRPLVRTRAATAAALLAAADLSSAIAHLVEPWADGRHPHSWLTAANALTMAQLLGVPTVIRILHDWCTGDDDSRRWTAIRAYGLLGPVHHEAVLEALVEAIHHQPPEDPDPRAEDTEDAEDIPESERQFADALQLLLLAVGEPVLSALAELIEHDRAVRPHALRAFRQACEQPADEGGQVPPVLLWYAQADAEEDLSAAQHLTRFWEAILADRAHQEQALLVVRDWVHAADSAPAVETALAALLPALARTAINHRRVSHLLRTVHDSTGSRSPAADRLQALLPVPRPT
ncbi:hypothetical protein ACIRF8_01955 [Streptomyces sp. NPDC102406]|uniref:hypothetical protein n=1 Tax=Streptomyces sp. NPDC102406 TaxID=3366171 RepID=UPI0037F5C07E